MRTFRVIGAMLVAAIALPVWTAAAPAWNGWLHERPAWSEPRWSSRASFPYPAPGRAPAFRLFHPPGLPLSYTEPSTGTTYCFTRATGFYYLCGYSRPAPEAAEPAAALRPRAVSEPREEAASAPSGVLLFRLPARAEAAVDGEPVGLSAGVGAAAVAPGRHRVMVRTPDREIERTVTVASGVILTITPTGITPDGS